MIVYIDFHMIFKSIDIDYDIVYECLWYNYT
jgi:hypothetical protein